MGVAALIAIRIVVAGDHPFDRVWAEDGQVFLTDWRERGLASLTYTYAGYLHTVPRLVLAAGAGQVALERFALWAVLAAIVIAGCVAAYVYCAAFARYRSAFAAAGAAAVIALTGALAAESLGTLANLHWYFSYAAAWALLVEPDWRGGRWASSLIGLLAILSSALAALLLVPAALVHRRRILASWTARAMIAGGVVLALAMLFGGESHQGLNRSPSIHFEILRLAIVAVFEPSAGVEGVVQPALGVSVIIGLGWLWRTADPDRRRGAAYLWGAGTLFYVAAATITGANALRYAATLGMFVLAGFALVATRARWVPAAVIALMFAANTATQFPANDRTLGKRWSTGVARFRAECRRGAAGPVKIPVSPNDNFTALLRCERD